ncbi:MAG TPA: hypothetical protein VLA55_06235 [Ornithinibacter sp.]|nr:hypothetical protein [Ornithinibacter sp.]
MSWRDRAQLDWTWAFVLTPLDEGQRTRYHFRSRWVTEPWWFSAFGLLGVVPADFVMARDHLRGVKHRAEAPTTAPEPDDSATGVGVGLVRRDAGAWRKATRRAGRTGR